MAAWETELKEGQKPSFAPSLPMGTAVLADYAPDDICLRSARPERHFPALVGVYGVP